MLLITEDIDQPIEMLVEETNGKKNHYITGIFMQAEQKNRNGRIYPRSIMERELAAYQKLVDGKRALGELNHPQSPAVNPERASHLVTELRFDENNNVIGKAKLLSAPMGLIAKSLIEDGVQLGVSTRGMGSVKMNRQGINEVQSDFRLCAVDIVSDPSGPDCWVAGIMEGVEWLYDEKTGMYQVAEDMKNTIKKLTMKQIDEQKLDLFSSFLSKLGSN